MTIYRKIYEQHYGSIPIDKEGRTYEIHHIDGNHENNNITNLVCVSIKEHYKIHKKQGDHGACMAILNRWLETSEQKTQRLSRYSKKLQKKLLAEGRHSSQSSIALANMSKAQKVKVEDGTHHFLSGEIQKLSNAKRIADGTHNFLGNTNENRKYRLIEVSEGRCNLTKLMKDGLHSSQIKKNCDCCGRQISLSNYKRHHKSCLKRQNTK